MTAEQDAIQSAYQWALRDEWTALFHALADGMPGGEAKDHFARGLVLLRQARDDALAILTTEEPRVTQFKLGRIRPTPGKRLMMSNFVAADLPVPPRVEHWSYGDYVDMMNIYGNDRLGDCTAAGAAHIIAAWRANAGDGAPAPTLEQAIAFYSATTGYVPGDPSTDRGGNEVTVLDGWRDKGFFADGSGKIEGWANVDASNALRVKQAIWLFENVYFGVELPDAWTRPFPQGNGFTWGVAGDANPNEGHCFVGLGYNDNGVIVNTWGMMGTVTWAAVAKYASAPGGELHVALGADAIARASAKAPNGFDLAALTTDLATFS